MVLNLSHLAARRQDVGESALPLGRVWALAVTPRGSRVGTRLDAAANPARGFRLLGPDRIEHLNNQPGIDSRDRKFTHYRVHIGGQRIAPLLPVLWVPPAGLVSDDELL